MNAPFQDLTGRAVEHLSERSDPCPLSEVSQIIHANKFTALRKFRAHTGMTPRQFQMLIRIHRAMDILKNLQCTIAEVGELCGFSNPSHFARVFRKKTGLSPTEYRKRLVSGVPSQEGPSSVEKSQ